MTRRSPMATTAIAVILALATCVAFLPLRHNGFIFFDDNAYITRNPHVTAGVTGTGLLWALRSTAASNWHPLAWAAHMLDVQLFGMNPAAHHLSSLALHALTAALLYLTMVAMTGRRRRSLFVAALFAVHPLHVESVAWASEKKDLLGGLFWVLTLGAYLRYARRPGTGRYGIVVVCFLLGLTAKPMLVTLPFVLLLLDWWPIGRITPAFHPGGRPGFRSPARIVAEKIPLFALSSVAAGITFLVQRESHAVKGLDLIPLVPRIFNAGYSYVRYLGKTAWPFGLSPFYPHPGPDLSLAASLLSLGALLTVTIVIRLLWRSRPWLAVGWLWYLGTLLPVIGIVQVGWQGMADRYTYLPLIGVFTAIAWEAGEDIADGWRRRAAVPALLLLVGLGALTWRQTAFWRDSVSVFARAVAVTPGNMLAEHYLGTAHRLAGNAGEAVRHLQAAIRINPRFPDNHAELGVVLSERGDLAGAVRAYERALQLEPESAPTHNNLGYALERLGRLDEALRHYKAALRINPRHARAHTNAGMVLARLGRSAEAAEHLRAAAAAERELP